MQIDTLGLILYSNLNSKRVINKILFLVIYYMDLRIIDSIDTYYTLKFC